MACQSLSQYVPLQRPALTVAVFLGLALSVGNSGEPAKTPYKINVRDEKATVVAMAEGPVDPVVRIRLQQAPNLFISLQGEQGQTLHLSHFPTLVVDGRVINIGQGEGRIEGMQKLPKSPSGKERHGHTVSCLADNIRVIQSIEVVPTRAPKPEQKRQMDAVMVRHTIENLGKADRKIGLRVYMDTYIVDNDGCLFAAPTMPNKVLNGVELKEKTLPEYVQLLQRPDLKNPGYVAHLGLNVGSKMDKANRVVLTHHGNGLGAWEMPPNPSNGDSALGIFWDPQALKAGAKRETAYFYGKGLGTAPENDGRFSLQLGGSMEPGKLFTVSALVNDPAPGQVLSLELPRGMERLEGRDIEPVPAPAANRAQSIVLWKARVLEPGEFQVRVRSSTGLTQAKAISIVKE